MVQTSNPAGAAAAAAAPPFPKAAAAVKRELEESAADEPHGLLLLDKRSKKSDPSELQWGEGVGSESSQTLQYHSLLHEPSPLGLRLRKSPSLLDLIQMRLSQADSAPASCATIGDPAELAKRKDNNKAGGLSNPNTSDKLKASNFPASLLRIGTWEFASKYEGDLVAKFYFAKHKLVWEVLEDGLKSKIEIQWSDVAALKATSPDDGPGTFDILLARQPIFFRETNPQPRKHTLWQATADFTNGQASICRKHFLQCPQGLLAKHFEKLIQCDPRLNSLSQQLDIITESHYFDSEQSMLENNNETRCHDSDNSKERYGPTFSGFRDSGSPGTGPSASSDIEVTSSTRTHDFMARGTPSPSSGTQVTKFGAIEECAPREAKVSEDQHTSQGRLKVPGGRNPSMSVSDSFSDFGNYISGQINSGGDDITTNRDVLEELTQRLLSDTQFTSASDERSLMSRVDSLCCLLQKDTGSLKTQAATDAEVVDKEPAQNSGFRLSVGDEPVDSSCKQAPGMSRKESFGDLLLNLPRIASMPQFLFQIPEDLERHAR